jgi:hypothetical protein
MYVFALQSFENIWDNLRNEFWGVWLEAFVDIFRILFKNIDLLPEVVYKNLQSEKPCFFSGTPYATCINHLMPTG